MDDELREEPAEAAIAKIEEHLKAEYGSNMSVHRPVSSTSRTFGAGPGRQRGPDVFAGAKLILDAFCKK
jgi:hypothetical protein